MDLKKYADVMIFALKSARKGGKFKKGENILVSYDMPALALAEEIYAKLTQQGFNAVVRPYATEKMAKILYTKGSDKQIKFTPVWEKVFTENLNGLIALRAPQNLANLKDVDPKKIALATLARKPIREIMDENGISDVSRVGLYGLTYKEDVDDVRESPALQLLESMRNHLGGKIRAYDPFVEKRLCDGQVFDFDEFLSEVDIVVVMTSHTHIKENVSKLSDKIVFDTRNIIPGEKVYKL